MCKISKILKFSHTPATCTERIKWKNKVLLQLPQYYKMPRSASIKKEDPSNWEKMLYPSSNNGVAVNYTDFNLAINMLHLIGQRLVLLFFMVSSGSR